MTIKSFFSNYFKLAITSPYMCLQSSVLYHAQSNNVEFTLWMGNMAKLQGWSGLRAFCSNKYSVNFQLLIPNMTTSRPPLSCKMAIWKECTVYGNMEGVYCIWQYGRSVLYMAIWKECTVYGNMEGVYCIWQYGRSVLYMAIWKECTVYGNMEGVYCIWQYGRSVLYMAIWKECTVYGNMEGVYCIWQYGRSVLYMAIWKECTVYLYHIFE